MFAPAAAYAPASRAEGGRGDRTAPIPPSASCRNQKYQSLSPTRRRSTALEAESLAAETGARAVSVVDAVKGVDLVVVTIPEKSVPLFPERLDGVPEAVIVVDTGNYYPSFRDGPIAAIESGMTESGWVGRQLRGPVLKAFNNIMATAWPKAASRRARLDGSRCRLPVMIHGRRRSSSASSMRSVSLT